MRFVLKDPSELGPHIRRLRKSLGLRQDDAAGACGVSENIADRDEPPARASQDKADP